jgi:hypothetical protein
MLISSVPVKSGEMGGLGTNARRYICTQTGETLCYVSMNKGEICIYTNRMLPIKSLAFIIEDHKRYF